MKNILQSTKNKLSFNIYIYIYIVIIAKNLTDSYTNLYLRQQQPTVL
jgi:hypothetical protein